METNHFIPKDTVSLALGGGIFTGRNEVSNFSGGGLQLFGGWGSPIFQRGGLRNTVNVRPVRILLECILGYTFPEIDIWCHTC